MKLKKTGTVTANFSLSLPDPAAISDILGKQVSNTAGEGGRGNT